MHRESWSVSRVYAVLFAALLFASRAAAEDRLIPAQSAAATPAFSPAGGTSRTALTVSITDGTPGSRIFYTTNDTTPTTGSTAYSGAISVSSTATLRAIAVATGYTRSPIAAAVFRIVAAVARPVFSPPGGAFSTAAPVTISDATPGATIFYTTDGTTPTPASLRYAGAISVGSSEAIKAIAVAPGSLQSSTAIARFTFIAGTVPTAPPKFSPAGGTFSAAQTVSITGGKAGVTLYYTTDGSAPTTSSIEYKGPISVAGTEVIQAIGVDFGYAQSAVVKAAYTITELNVGVTTLHSFGTGSDGNSPGAAILHASDGNFYGTTSFGGANGAGVAFKITPAGAYSILHTFTAAANGNPDSDGIFPAGGLIEGSDGDFYGTTLEGGSNNLGTIYKVTPVGVETVLYSFSYGVNGSLDGASPYARLVQGSDGNFYGTTGYGGADNVGTVYKVTAAGVESVLASFTGSGTGLYPLSSLIEASDGNFYGTTGGNGANDPGTVFKITPVGVKTVLYTFDASRGDPRGPLIEGSDGNLYGTTVGGGGFNFGTVFQLTLAGVAKILHSFNGLTAGSTDGFNALGGVMQGSDGNFYGTTGEGGGNANSAGTVFKITPTGEETIVCYVGSWPEGSLIEDSTGDFYGTTTQGGIGWGTVFKVTNVIQ